MQDGITCSRVISSVSSCGILVRFERKYDTVTQGTLESSGLPDSYGDYLVFISQDMKTQTKIVCNEWTPDSMRKMANFLIEQAARYENEQAVKK